MKPQKYAHSDYLLHALLNWCNTDSLNKFLKSVDYPTKKSRQACITFFIEYLNKEKTFEKQQEIIEKFNESVLMQIKMKRIKIVGLSYFATQRSSLDDNLQEVSKTFHVNNIYQANFNNIFQYVPELKAEIVYQNIKMNSTKSALKSIDLLFARKYKSDQNNNIGVDFTWLTLDIENRKAIFYFQSMKNNILASESPITPIINFKFISDYLIRAFGLRLHNEDSANQVYKVYKYLTTSNELNYRSIVEKAAVGKNGSSLIDKCYDNIEKNLQNGEHSNITDRIHAKDRIKNIFIRLLISNDFDDFKTYVSGRLGSVVAFKYHDFDGSSVNGRNGTGIYTSSKNIAPMESSTSYFDTKDTINYAELLESVDIIWKKYNLNHSTRYTAYPQFLTIHFIKSHIDEAVLKNVLHDFKQFTS